MKAELNKKKLVKGTDAVVPLTCKATGDYITGKMIDNQFYQIKSNGSYFKTPIEPKQGQVYEDVKTNKKYIWGGDNYVEFQGGKVSPDITIVNGDVQNLPDNEDIESVNDGLNNVLRFKDKVYAPANYSGLGRKYLRKNVVNDKNVLTQAMMQDANTIYIIQYDYDLNDASITVPSRCVLQFEGGSLSNGTLVGNNTAIEAGDYQIFSVGTIKYRGYSSSNPTDVHNWAYLYVSKIYGDDLEIKGTWNNSVVNPNWIGLNDIDSTKDSRLKIQRYIDLHSSNVAVSIPKNNYYTYGSIKQTKSIDFNGSSLICCKYVDIYDDTIELPDDALPLPEDDIRGLEMVYGLIQLRTNAANTYIKNVTIDGNRSDGSNNGNYEAIKYGIAGLYSFYTNSKGLLIENVTFRNSPVCGIIGGNPINATLKNVHFDSITEHGIYVPFTNTEKIIFENCTFHNCGDDQRMIEARKGFGYIIKTKVSSSNTRNHEFYFYNCEFSNDAELYYGLGNPPYSTPSYYRGGIQSGLGDFYFENCIIPAYLQHQISHDAFDYSLVGKWTFNNCRGIGTIPTESSDQQTSKTNTVVNCNSCTGEINYSQVFKSINNCNFTTRYVGKVYTTFYDDEYNNIPVVIEDSIINFKIYNNASQSFLHNPIIQNLIIKRSTLSQIEDIVSYYGLSGNCKNLTVEDCVITSKQPLASMVPIQTISLKNCTANCSDYLIRANTVTSVTIKDINMISGALFYRNTSPNTLIDNTDRSINNFKNITYNNLGSLTNINGNFNRANAVNAPIGTQLFITDRQKQLAIWDGSRWVNALGKKLDFQTVTSKYRPTSGFNDDDLGYLFFDKTLNKPLILTSVSNGSAVWKEFDGAAAGVKRNGATADRPTSTDIYIGFQYWDTDLGKMIVWNGSAWVNLDGTALT